MPSEGRGVGDRTWQVTVPWKGVEKAVTCVLDAPQGEALLPVTLVLAHGAGGSLASPFMEAMAAALAARGMRTVRFNFPYREAGRRMPDPRPLLLETWRGVSETVRARWPDGALVIGGKSMGGRMAGLHLAGGGAEDGIVYLGFPLRGPKGDEDARIGPMASIAVPQLYVQGTRDPFGDGAALRPYLAGMARARLLEVSDGDHGFAAPRRTGRTLEATLAWVAGEVAAWLWDTVCRERPGSAAINPR